ncbi:hypothetical protein PInf_019945 [Phytophthora infestans]|nr:hypothetical protein PInf_019945 [Phytophthora infestans]
MSRSYSTETPYRRSQSVTSHSQQHRGTPVLEEQSYMNAFSPPPNSVYVMETQQEHSGDAAPDGRRSTRQLPPVDQNGSFRLRHGTRGMSGASSGFVTMDNSSTISSSSGNYIDAMSLNNNMSATAQQPLISTPRATQKNIVRVIDKDMTQQFRGRSKSVGQGRIRWFENRKSQLLVSALRWHFSVCL